VSGPDRGPEHRRSAENCAVAEFLAAALTEKAAEAPAQGTADAEGGRELP
jgi:hypothetical protein